MVWWFPRPHSLPSTTSWLGLRLSLSCLCGPLPSCREPGGCAEEGSLCSRDAASVLEDALPGDTARASWARLFPRLVSLRGGCRRRGRSTGPPVPCGCFSARWPSHGSPLQSPVPLPSWPPFILLQTSLRFHLKASLPTCQHLPQLGCCGPCESRWEYVCLGQMLADGG